MRFSFDLACHTGRRKIGKSANAFSEVFIDFCCVVVSLLIHCYELNAVIKINHAWLVAFRVFLGIFELSYLIFLAASTLLNTADINNC